MLSREGAPLILSDKAFDALVYLVEHAGQLVTRDDLNKALWPNTVVEDNSLYVAISTLRRALKDEAAAPHLIATIAGRGYQFVADVHVVEAPNGHQAPVALTPAPIVTAGISKRRVALVVGALLAIAVGIGIVNALRPASRPASAVSLAVLPFKPLTSADRNESLEFGMAETLIAGLNAD